MENFLFEAIFNINLCLIAYLNHWHNTFLLSVYCDLDYNSTHAEMVLSHDTENKTHVTGHTTEGEYLKMITYDGMMYDQLLTLFDINQTEISMACRQSISYECYSK